MYLFAIVYDLSAITLKKKKILNVRIMCTICMIIYYQTIILHNTIHYQYFKTNLLESTVINF